MSKDVSIKDYLEIKSASAPSLRSDGRAVAYLSNESGTNQVWIVPTEGGSAEQLTSYDEPVTFVSFSPTKEEILFGMGSGGNEKTQLYLFELETRTARNVPGNRDFIYRFGGWSRDGKRITYSSNERNGTDFDVYVMELESGSARMVFDRGGWGDSLGFSPSGTYVAVRQQHTFLRHDLFLVDVETGKAELVTAHEDNAEYGRPLWLPDERGFFFASNEDTDLVGLDYYDRQRKSRERVLSPAWDVESVALSEDGKRLAVVTNEDGFGRLMVYDVATMRPLKDQTFPQGIIEGIEWSRDGNSLTFAFESATKTSDAWIWSAEGNSCRQLTFCACDVPTERFVEPELIHAESFDGLKVPSFLFLPKGRVGRVPVIVSIHGGPEGQVRPYFNPLTQYWVSRGYAVIAPNVRGSSGYGKRYLALDDREKRMDSVRDLAALHAFARASDTLDSTRMALMGGSYGGYMTLAGLAFQPDLWAAGVDIVGMSNLVTFLENTSVWRRALREAEYGSLETDRELLQSLSPLNAISKIKAPLLIIHGKNDPRVPVSEAEQMHRQLNAQGGKADLLVYEDEGHGLSKLKNRLDAYPKVAAFLDAVLK